MVALPLSRRDEPPRVIDEPEPGFYMIRIYTEGVRSNEWIPAAIHVEDGMWQAEVDGKFDGPPDTEPTVAVWRIWHNGRRITFEEFLVYSAERKPARRPFGIGGTMSDAGGSDSPHLKQG